MTLEAPVLQTIHSWQKNLYFNVTKLVKVRDLSFADRIFIPNMAGFQDQF